MGLRSERYQLSVLVPVMPRPTAAESQMKGHVTPLLCHSARLGSSDKSWFIYVSPGVWCCLDSISDHPPAPKLRDTQMSAMPPEATLLQDGQLENQELAQAAQIGSQRVLGCVCVCGQRGSETW